KPRCRPRRTRFACRAHRSQEPAELLVGQARVAHDVAHGDRVDRVVPGDDEDAAAVRHHDVLTLAGHPEAGLLQGADGIQGVDPGQPGHGYTSTSTSRTRASPLRRSSRTARYSRMASAMFSRASCSVAPCEWQPGSPGTEAAKPSSDSWRLTLYFIAAPRLHP